jgi:DNA-binding NarL/FixJ family response regulator
MIVARRSVGFTDEALTTLTWPKGENLVCIRVLIADDQPRARRSLKALLTAMRWGTPNHTEPSTYAELFPLEIIGEAQDGQEAVEQVWALHPDVVLMDLQMHTVFAPEPRLNGLATIQMIKRQWPAIRIVVLTMYATDRASVLTAGADAFLLKGCPTSELLDAVIPKAPTRLN